MKYLFLIISLVTAESWGDEELSCDYSHEGYVSIFGDDDVILRASVKGRKCYETALNIKLMSKERVLYSYSAPFKSHVATHWEDLELLDVKKYVDSLFKEYRFSSCAELLPQKLSPLDGWNYNRLLVAEIEYSKFRAMPCKSYTHQTHYEVHRVIVFPISKRVGVPVAEYGL
ncbi:hypothetical protein [Teredinibacter franksiae]|uniref:hypothetical protein n=1 Tax=Teredinibacter franksiae TaxID=2761453 RepID=UPI0016255DCF|nr:hypothetical protein [Teredinibacter franksiae]